MPVASTILREANVVGVLAEATTADVQTVLANNATTIVAHTAAYDKAGLSPG